MQQFIFKQYISSNIDTSDQLYSMSREGKHINYNWMIHHLQHVSMWGTWRNFIFKEMYPIISKEEYNNWYLSITR
jgi:hypothetical protein